MKQNNFVVRLTRRYMQCVQSAPIAAVPTSPKMSPPFLNAFGMARIPLPRLLLIKCNKAPLSLYYVIRVLQQRLGKDE